MSYDGAHAGPLSGMGALCKTRTDVVQKTAEISAAD